MNGLNDEKMANLGKLIILITVDFTYMKKFLPSSVKYYSIGYLLIYRNKILISILTL